MAASANCCQGAAGHPGGAVLAGLAGRPAASQMVRGTCFRNGLKKLPFPAIKPVIDIW
jgi:hypothetical protein